MNVLMQDYLNSTERARHALWSGVLEAEEPIGQSKRDLVLLDRLYEAVLSPSDSDPSDLNLRTRLFRDQWGCEPTPDAIKEAREWTSTYLTERRRSVSVLCGAILMIAQNGVKLVVGAPAVWQPLQNRIMSWKGEAVLPAIWHGRNQAAHVEGLILSQPSGVYFTELERRLGQRYSCLTNGDFIPELMVREVLGWIPTIEDSVQSRDAVRTSYGGDMFAIGALVGR
jgi:hypothetical protein